MYPSPWEKEDGEAESPLTPVLTLPLLSIKLITPVHHPVDRDIPGAPIARRFGFRRDASSPLAPASVPLSPTRVLRKGIARGPDNILI